MLNPAKSTTQGIVSGGLSKLMILLRQTRHNIRSDPSTRLHPRGLVHGLHARIPLESRTALLSARLYATVSWCSVVSNGVVLRGLQWRRCRTRGETRVGAAKKSGAAERRKERQVTQVSTEQHSFQYCDRRVLDVSSDEGKIRRDVEMIADCQLQLVLEMLPEIILA